MQIDVRIDEIVMRALERDPDMRYSQASIFKTEVETVATAQARLGPPTPLTSPPPLRTGSRRPARPLLSAVIVALLCGVATFLALRSTTYTAVGILAVQMADGPQVMAIDSVNTSLRHHVSAIQEPAFLQTAMATLKPTSQNEPLLRLSSAQLAAQLAVDAIPDTVLIRVRYTDSDPSRAALAAETIMHAYCAAASPSELTLSVAKSPEVPGPQSNASRRLLLSGWATVFGGALGALVLRFGRVPWRTVNKPLNGPPQSPPPVPAKGHTNQVRPTQRESEPPANHRVAWVLAAVTLALHTALFLALVLFAAFIVPRFAVIFMDFKTEMPLLTRMTLALSRGMIDFWYVAIPLFVAANAGICFLLGNLNARRSLIGWLICGTALLLAVGVAMFLSLFLPIYGLLR